MPTDPTLQASGSLTAVFKNLTNSVILPASGNAMPPGAKVTAAPPTYGPPAAPPPAWPQGSGQWTGYSGQVPPFLSQVPSSQSPASPNVIGTSMVAVVKDMSTAMVQPGKFYYFANDVQVGAAAAGWMVLRLYWQLSGTSSGTTVLPGFGLYNLGTAPAAWTYVTPTGGFDGNSFTIYVNTPVFLDQLRLTVAYAPPRWKSSLSSTTSTLAYTVAAGAYTVPLSLTGDETGEAEPGTIDEDAPLDIAESSDPHELQVEEPALVP